MKTFKDPISTFLRRKRTSKILTLDNKIEAAHMVFVLKETQTVVAKHFRVTAPTISRLVKMLLKNTSLLSELLSKKNDIKME